MIDKVFCDRVSSASLGGYEVKYNTWELCELAIQNGIEGDFAEAGVYKGSHPMIMAEVALRNNDNRKIHLYDSFEGVPKARQERDYTFFLVFSARLKKMIVAVPKPAPTSIILPLQNSIMKLSLSNMPFIYLPNNLLRYGIWQTCLTSLVT